MADLAGAPVDNIPSYDGLAHAPTDVDLPTEEVLTVDVHRSEGNPIALIGPREATVVGVLEGDVADRVGADSLTVPLGDVGRVVSVESVYAPARYLQWHHPRGLGWSGWLDVDGIGPGLALILADGGDDVLLALALMARPGGHRAEPVAFVGDDDIRLVAVALVGNRRAGDDVAEIGGHVGTPNRWQKH